MAAKLQTVGEPARDQEPDSIRQLEGAGHPSILDGGEADDPLEVLFEKADNAAIHIGDHGGEKQQSTDDPAKARRGWPDGSGGHEDLIISCSDRGN
jgi:hypothetical protein